MPFVICRTDFRNVLHYNEFSIGNRLICSYSALCSRWAEVFSRIL